MEPDLCLGLKKCVRWTKYYEYYTEPAREIRKRDIKRLGLMSDRNKGEFDESKNETS